jgi:hypothetical protein
MGTFTLEPDGVLLAGQQSIGRVHAALADDAPMPVGRGPQQREKPREPATGPSRFVDLAVER